MKQTSSNASKLTYVATYLGAPDGGGNKLPDSFPQEIATNDAAALMRWVEKARSLVSAKIAIELTVF